MSWLTPAPDREEQISSLFMQHLRLSAQYEQPGNPDYKSERLDAACMRISRQLERMGSGV